MADTPEQKLDIADKETSIIDHNAAIHDDKPETISSRTRSLDGEKNERPNNSYDKQVTAAEKDSEVLGPTQDAPPTAEPLSEQPIHRVTTPGEDYSVLTVTQKKLIILTASFASLFSPMATAIYCK